MTHRCRYDSFDKCPYDTCCRWLFVKPFKYSSLKTWPSLCNRKAKFINFSIFEV